MDTQQELHDALDHANHALHELHQACALDDWSKAHLMDALEFADSGMACAAVAAVRAALVPPSSRSRDPDYVGLVPNLRAETFDTLRRRFSHRGIRSPR